MQLSSCMNRSLLVGSILLALSIELSPAQSLTGAVGQIDEIPLERFIEGQLAEQHIPGMAVALVVDGDVVWAKGVGYADFASKRPVTQDTLFLNGIGE